MMESSGHFAVALSRGSCNSPRDAWHDAGSSTYDPVKRSHSAVERGARCAHAVRRTIAPRDVSFTPLMLLPTDVRRVLVRGVSGHLLERREELRMRRALAHR